MQIRKDTLNAANRKFRISALVNRLTYLKRDNSFFEECLENVDLILITSEFSSWLIFIDLKVESVFLENLDGSLWW